MWLTRMSTAAALLLVTGVLATGAYLVGHQTPAPRPVEMAGAGKKEARTDLDGDPLPPGVLARLGTARLRHPYTAQIAFSPDGKTLLSAGHDHTVRVWDVRTGKQLHRRLLPEPDRWAGIYSNCLLAADGKTLVGLMDGEGLYVWDTVTGKELRRIRISLKESLVLRLALSANGKVVAEGIQDGKDRHTVILWDTATGKERLRLVHQGRYSGALTFSPDGKLLATGSGRDFRIRDTVSGEAIHKLRGEVCSLRFSPDGKVLASGLYDGTVRLWAVADGKEQATLKGEPGHPVHFLVFSRDGCTLAAWNHEEVTVWDLRSRKALRKVPAGGWLALSPDGKILASSAHSVIRLWDVATGKPLHPQGGHQGPIGSVTVSPDGKALASTSLMGGTAVHLWDPATGKPLAVLRGHESYARTCAFSADGKLLVSGGYDGTVRLWDVAGGKERRAFTIPPPKGETDQPRVRDLRLWPDGKRLAALSMVGDVSQVSLWDTASGKLLARRPFRGAPRSSGLSPDGHSAAVITSDEFILEDTATGRELVTVRGTFSGPMAFSHDSKLLAAAIYPPGWHPGRALAPGEQPARMQGIGIWELATGKQLGRLDIRAAGHITFSPDGRLLATADMSALRLWDLATLKEVFRRERHDSLGVPSSGEAFVSSLAFLPRGDAIATGLPDSTTLIWDLEPGTWRAGLTVKDLDRKDLDRLWADLTALDPARAHRAMETLAAAPAKAIPFLKDHLRPAAAISAERVERLLGDLDSERFTVRDAAARELAGMGEQIAPALRKLLESKPSLEVQKRVESLLDAALVADRGTVGPGPILRTLRSIRLLERLGKPEARGGLRQLAAGAPAARITREANEALQRLARRPPTR